MSSFPYIFLFSSTLFISTFLALSASHWLIIWVALELNMISFVPLIIFSSWHQETEASINYFLFQALGSSLLLLGSYSPSFFFLIILGIIVNLGMAPFHYWFPSVINSISWPICLLLTTWQNIVPLFILISISTTLSSSICLAIASLNTIVGGIGGLNQTQIRPLLAYSSISHIGWIIAASPISSFVSATYFLIYTLTSITLFLYLFFLNSTTPKLFSSTVLSSLLNILTLSLLLLSLGGLPPLTGFLPNWMVIASLDSLISPTFLILGSLINLFYYLNICLSSALSNASPVINGSSSLSSFPLFIISTLLLPIFFV